MDTKKEFKYLLWITTIFIAAFYLPLESVKFNTAISAILGFVKWYAREHAILCLLPAFFIAGVIAVFVSHGSVLRYFGANAKKWVASSVAAVSGTILAVCSCTILPLFSSIHKRGAGLGPALAFLYSGPTINILAIILTFGILGFEIGVTRIIGAVSFAVLIGIIISLIYRREEQSKREEQMNFPIMPEKKPMWQTSFHFFALVLILVFANWGSPAEGDTSSTWFYIFSYKWHITGFFSLFLIYSLIKILKIRWRKVMLAILTTAVTIVLSSLYIDNAKLSPLVLVMVGIVALSIITFYEKKDPDNRECPLLSLPNMLVIRGVTGTQKTIVYVSLVIVMATMAGLIYGSFFRGYKLYAK